MTKTMREAFDKKFAIHQGRKWIFTKEESNEVWNWHISQLQSVFEEIGVEIEMLRGREDNQINYYPLYKAVQRLEKKYLLVKDKK